MSRDTNKSTTVLKALQVLETVAALPAPATAPEISKQSGIERVTTYRLLRTLEHAGYVNLHPDSKTYRISGRVLSLAKPVLENGPDRRLVGKLLESVSSRTGETCHFSERNGQETILTQRAKGTQLVAVDFNIGTRCELHATSVGKAILANQPDDFIESYLETDLKRYTSRTMTDKAKLLAEFDTIRSSGVSLDLEELSEGMNCVAVPFAFQDGPVEAGISISGPSNRLTKTRLRELAVIMREEAAKFQ